VRLTTRRGARRRFPGGNGIVREPHSLPMPSHPSVQHADVTSKKPAYHKDKRA
jgi:hypothetical protein